MKKTLTVCPYCGCGCAIYLHVEENRITGVSPSISHPVNKGSLCVKGWNAHEFVQHPDRLKYPMIRKNGELTRSTWDVVLVAGGIGFIPLRPLIQFFMNNSEEMQRITLFYGARTPQDVVFMDEIERWQKEGIKVVLTVDCADDSWSCNVGLVTTFLTKDHADFMNAVAYVCGPEIMINSSMKELSSLGMPDDRIITTLEAHMKCGVGKCGHCYTGSRYICTDGHVFSYKEVKKLIPF